MKNSDKINEKTRGKFMNLLLSSLMERLGLPVYYVAYLILLSFITFFAYGLDKIKAKNKGFRISEKALLSLSFLGGAFGGLIGMKVFRHKTAKQHWYFRAINVLGIVIHSALIVVFALFI